jgi:hypothetical protein
VGDLVHHMAVGYSSQVRSHWQTAVEASAAAGLEGAAGVGAVGAVLDI